MIDWITWWWAPPALVEPATVDDCAGMAEIHAESFRHAWSEEEIASLMRQDGVIALVARRGSAFGTRAVIGFVLIRAVAGEAEVLTVAVGGRQRGRGLGRRLMEAAMRQLYHDRVGALFLEVDNGNEAALALYRRLGFLQVGERKGYYRDGSVPGATALVMRVDLD